jgi:predicted GNAT family N-acyltransferase
MKNFRINFLAHKDITKKDLISILRFKDNIWSYGIESQISWIKKNIRNSDIHVYISKKKEIVAYANLIDGVSMNLNNLVGIGNISVLEKFRGNGYGSILIKIILFYLKTQKKDAILICKKNLISFYKKNGFKVIKPLNLHLNFPVSDDNYFMANFISPQKVELYKTF